MDGYITSIELFKPGEPGVHLYVPTNREFGEAVCIKCGKAIDHNDLNKIHSKDRNVCMETKLGSRIELPVI